MPSRIVQPFEGRNSNIAVTNRRLANELKAMLFTLLASEHIKLFQLGLTSMGHALVVFKLGRIRVIIVSIEPSSQAFLRFVRKKYICEGSCKLTIQCSS